MLVKALAGLSAIAGVMAMIDFEPAGDGTYNVLLDGVHVTELGGADANETTPFWLCDVRAWTRAPDLSPGKVLPADARLAANGSACGDIVKWEVGMRLKERALIKIRAKGVEFPKEPIRPTWNESFHSSRRNDYNDPMQTNMYWRPHQDPAELEYAEAMEEYQEKLRNSSLWLLRGQERIVYDLTRQMELGNADPEQIDIVQSFAIHMPPTNFPPIERYSGYYGGRGDQMLVTETLSEFYHLLTLTNGTVLDFPSGEIAIIPANTALKRSSDSRSGPIPDIDWPQTIDFPPTNHNVTVSRDKEFRYGYIHSAPSCDEYNAANFTLRVDSNVTQPILGQNITLNLTLTRTGNGSEYPAWIDVAHSTETNITWAYRFVANESEYNELKSDMGPREVRYMRGGPEPKVRMAPSIKQLEVEKKEKERSTDGAYSACSYGYFGISGPPLGHQEGRYDLLEDDKEPKEEYTFGLEVALPERDLPSFQKTFESFRSSLVFTLYTYFACDPRNIDTTAGSSGPAETSQGWSELDKEWDRYALPTRKSKRSSLSSRGIMIPRTRLVPLDAVLSSALTGATGSDGAEIDEARVDLVHYLDETALSPVLSASVGDKVSFPLLDQAVRDETEEERKRSRWGSGARGRQRGWCDRPDASSMCYELNGGGGDKLASSMWQGKVAKEKEVLGSRGSDAKPPADKEVKGNAFVVQAPIDI